MGRQGRREEAERTMDNRDGKAKQADREGKPAEKGGWAKLWRTAGDREKKKRADRGGKSVQTEAKGKKGGRKWGEKRTARGEGKKRRRDRLPERIKNGGQQRWKGEADRER